MSSFKIVLASIIFVYAISGAGEISTPESIPVTVEAEGLPFAFVSAYSNVFVLDFRGSVVEILDDKPEGLIEIIGIGAVHSTEGEQLRVHAIDEGRLRHMQNILTAFFETGIGDNVTFLDMTNIAQISFDYTDNFLVLLGSADNLMRKLHTLSGAIVEIDYLFGQDASGIIDLNEPMIARFIWSD